jgi:hypothetical protein
VHARVEREGRHRRCARVAAGEGRGAAGRARAGAPSGGRVGPRVRAARRGEGRVGRERGGGRGSSPWDPTFGGNRPPDHT